MTGKDRLTVAAVIAVLGSGIALSPLTRDRTYLMLAGFLLLISAGVGAAARRLIHNEALVRLLQAVPVVLLGWLVPETLHPITLASDTYDYIQQASAPMPFQVGFAVFCVLLLWVSYLVIESLVNGADAPAWTFLPLITPFLIAAAFGYFEANAALFALPAAGFGLLLATHSRSRVVEDSGADTAHSFATQSWRTGIRRAGAVTTVGAIVATMLAGMTLPENTHVAKPTAGPGGVRFNDPSLDLIRNLNLTSDDPVLSYKTTSANGVNLRLTALPLLDETGFHPADTALQQLPLQGQQAIDDRALVATTVSITNFSSEYLPVPWVPVNVDVPGTWNWDLNSLAVIATGSTSDTATRNLHYQVTSAVDPSLESLLYRTSSPSPGLDPGAIAIPNGLSPEADSLVTRLTQGRRTAGEQALAIRNYLRSNLFTYSTDTEPGTTMDTLNDFLFGTRTGYCEQFAGAMAVLARIAGIPSRVVVGFRPGTRTGDVWQVTPHDMHAWAELYFDGLGWLAVDATPPGVFAAESTASASPSAKPTKTVAEPTILPTSLPSHESPTGPTTDDSGTNALGLGALIALGTLVIAAAIPSLVRRLQRAWRQSGRSRQPLEAAWDEVWATARDRDVGWPPGSSRAVATALAGELDEPARGDLVALALAVEKERYAPPVPEPDAEEFQAAAWVSTVRQAVEHRWPTRKPLDLWWPRSLWPRSR